MKADEKLNLETLVQSGCRVIAFSGQIGSGKSTVAHAVSEALGLELLRSRKYLESALKILDMPVTEANMQAIGRFFVSTVGGDGLTLRVLHSRQTNSIGYDSFRNIDEVHMLRDVLGSAFQLIYIDATQETRLRRYLGRPGRDNDIASFEKREAHEVERDVIRLKEVSDLIVPEAEIEASVSTVLTHIGKIWSQPNV